jgi:hypothetical protein
VTTLPAPMMESSPTETRKHDGGRAEPDVRADRDGAPEFEKVSAGLRISGVVGREELHARGDLRAVADRHEGAIQDHGIEVDEHVVADRDVGAVVAREGRLDERVGPDPTEELP